MIGCTRQGLAISWPGHIKDEGGIRTQFHHVIDIVLTILEAVGIHRRRKWSNGSNKNQKAVEKAVEKMFKQWPKS